MSSSIPTVPKAEPFGTDGSGNLVEVFTLQNSRGVKMRVMTYGATVLSLETPDRTGKSGDIILGFNTLDEYLKGCPYFGAVVGRVGNRVANGKFVLDGTTYSLALNNEPGGIPCSLHGGVRGFDKVVWGAEGLVNRGAQGVRFQYLSRDGEEGYPGNLNVTVTYWLTETNEWVIEYEGRTDKATPVNLTQHCFFNLRGEGDGDILGHELRIAASHFTPATSGLIPTGEIRSVEGTALDFTQPRIIGDRVDDYEEQMKFAGGYDHNFVLKGPPEELNFAASVYEPSTGRGMEVLTTEPGMQFYCGNFLDGTLRGKSGMTYEYRTGFCLETQHYPDSVNQPNFPTTILRPGESLKSTTIYRFFRR